MASNPLVGTWRLVSLETEVDGKATYPLGPDARGYILYSHDGFVFVVLAASHRRPYASGDLLGGTPEEKAAAAETYISYCGRYEVQEGKVIHHVEHSLFPNWVGADQVRFLHLDGNRLTLSTPPLFVKGEVQVGRLIWERA